VKILLLLILLLLTVSTTGKKEGDAIDSETTNVQYIPIQNNYSYVRSKYWLWSGGDDAKSTVIGHYTYHFAKKKSTQSFCACPCRQITTIINMQTTIPSSVQYTSWWPTSH